MVCGHGGLRAAVLVVRPEISWTGRRGYWCEFTKRLEQPTNQQQEQTKKRMPAKRNWRKEFHGESSLPRLSGVARLFVEVALKP